MDWKISEAVFDALRGTERIVVLYPDSVYTPDGMLSSWLLQYALQGVAMEFLSLSSAATPSMLDVPQDISHATSRLHNPPLTDKDFIVFLSSEPWISDVYTWAHGARGKLLLDWQAVPASEEEDEKEFFTQVCRTVEPATCACELTLQVLNALTLQTMEADEKLRPKYIPPLAVEFATLIRDFTLDVTHPCLTADQRTMCLGLRESFKTWTPDMFDILFFSAMEDETDVTVSTLFDEWRAEGKLKIETDNKTILDLVTKHIRWGSYNEWKSIPIVRIPNDVFLIPWLTHVLWTLFGGQVPFLLFYMAHPRMPHVVQLFLRLPSDSALSASILLREWDHRSLHPFDSQVLPPRVDNEVSFSSLTSLQTAFHVGSLEPLDDNGEAHLVGEVESVGGEL